MAVTFTGLDSYKLSGVNVTDRILGRGAYATVLELEYMGLKCAGKKIHEVLLVQENASYVVRYFQEECHLLSRLHHPNIVQFLGVYFQDNAQVPILVMESLPMNLTSCIEDHGIIPNEIGYPILYGVALGLCFLHNQNPHVIHRDLSSNNILLNANLTAKISDLGMARILNMNGLEASRMSRIPGTPAYMPPEIFGANPRYDTSVDVFSYGVMIIHVLSGQWPEPQGSPIRVDGDKLIPVSEVERREVYLKIIGNDHALMELICQCISNNSELRPASNKIVKQLAELVKRFSSDVPSRLDQLVRNRTVTENVSDPISKGRPENVRRGCIRRNLVDNVNFPSSAELDAQVGCSSKQRLSSDSAIPALMKEESSAGTEMTVMKKVSKQPEISVAASKQDSNICEKHSLPSSHEVICKTDPTPADSSTQNVDDYVKMFSASARIDDLSKPQVESQESSCPIHPICVADFDYRAEDSSELSFNKGDMFAVTYSRKNWWLVRSFKTGKEGLVPGNYVSIPLDAEEIDQTQIALVKTIGTGHFSIVWEGLMNGKKPVAVKVLKPEELSSANDFLKKAAMLKVLSHPCIVHLSAVCTKKTPVFVVIELMKHGNLLKYLRSEGRSLGLRQLITMGSQVAEGMAHLEGQGYIHRDVAARSVLVGENLVCKLANFHLAQVVHGKPYEAPTDEKVAIKWTAPEAAKNNAFTIKSDVWSFGVLLFELITYGRLSPYPGMTNSQVMKQVQQGYRMPQPMDCPSKLYAIMLSCWKEEPKVRPKFKTLQRQLHKFFM